MKIKILILFFFSFFLSACNDWLNVDSKIILNEDDIANYPELAEAQFLSNYLDLRKSLQCIGDGALSYRQHHLDAFTDDGASNIAWGSGIMQNNSPGLVYGGIFSQTNGESFTPVWNYKTINTINKYIQTYKTSANNEVLSTVGEAYFIRAYLYFEMVKRYGGVPLYSTSLDNISSINNRSTEEESWNYIRDNLDSAIVLLPESQRFITEDRDRSNKYTALALKSRAMLYAGTIAKYGKVTNNGLQGINSTSAAAYLLLSAQAAKSVIDANKYSLSSNFEDLFNGKDENNNEIIFRFKNNPKTGTQVFHDYWNMSYKVKKQGYTAFMVPSLNIVEQFETLTGTITPLDYAAKKTDLKDFFADRDKRLAATVIFPGGQFMGETYSIYKETRVYKSDGTQVSYKYSNFDDWSKGGTVPGYPQYMKSGLDGMFYNEGAGFTNWGFYLKKTLFGGSKLEDYLAQLNDQDAVIIRYGEVILNFAEAAVELSETGNNEFMAQAQTEFDNLRRIHGGLPAKNMNKDIVRHERRIDLLYEGFRYWDQKRWRIGTEMHNTTLNALSPILNIDERTIPTTVYFTIEKTLAPQLATRVKWFEERDYYSPLPVANSPGIIQNIGW